MLILKRFEREYLSDRIKRIKDNDQMNEHIKSEMLTTLGMYRRCRENGLITTDEFIDVICHIGSYVKEI